MELRNRREEKGRGEEYWEGGERTVKARVMNIRQRQKKKKQRTAKGKKDGRKRGQKVGESGTPRRAGAGDMGEKRSKEGKETQEWRRESKSREKNRRTSGRGMARSVKRGRKGGSH